jgi:hypothetical protein
MPHRHAAGMRMGIELEAAAIDRHHKPVFARRLNRNLYSLGATLCGNPYIPVDAHRPAPLRWRGG